MDFLADIAIDALIDTLRVLPFLFVCYLAMEAIEHAAGDRAEQAMRRAGLAGPVVGALAGAFPQCGFSTAAATLYSGRVITLGTLLAVFLATSDEMLPILIAEQAVPMLMAKIIGCKVAIGMLMGFAIDAASRALHNGGGDAHFHIHEMCEQEHCGCHEGVLRSALRHTLQVTLLVFLVSLAIGGAIEAVGEESFAVFLGSNPVLAVLAAATVGLIPNCAASVVITELFLDGALSGGAMMAGLLVSAGVGLLVLLRANRPHSRNAAIVAMLWAIGVAWGLAFDSFGISFL